jgi:hypothetical protein
MLIELIIILVLAIFLIDLVLKDNSPDINIYKTECDHDDDKDDDTATLIYDPTSYSSYGNYGWYNPYYYYDYWRRPYWSRSSYLYRPSHIGYRLKRRVGGGRRRYHHRNGGRRSNRVGDNRRKGCKREK